MPHRLAIALDADGWIGRNEIIWQKGEGTCESVTNWCARNHEQVLLFAKCKTYDYDIATIKEPAKYANDRRKDRRIEYNGKYDGDNGRGQRSTYYGIRSENRIKRDVWSIPTQSTKFDHCAPMPEKLVRPMVLAGCPKGGRVLDPFAGAGTVGLVANALDRNATLIEIWPKYAAVTEERIRNELSKCKARLAGCG
jgi:DNA modification methylase